MGSCQLALHAKSQEKSMNVLEEVINLRGGKNGGNYLVSCWILGIRSSDGWIKCSYIASLESRVERLEKKLAALDNRRASVGMLEPQSEPQTPNDHYYEGICGCSLHYCQEI